MRRVGQIPVHFRVMHPPFICSYSAKSIDSLAKFSFSFSSTAPGFCATPHELPVDAHPSPSRTPASQPSSQDLPHSQGEHANFISSPGLSSVTLRHESERKFL